MLDFFTDKARAAIVQSHRAAVDLGRDAIDSCALLLGLIATGGGVAAQALAELGVSQAAVREHGLSQGPRRATDAPPAHMPFTAELKQALEAAPRQAIALGHINLTTGHLLLGLTVVPASAGARALASLGVEVDAVRAAVRSQHAVNPGGDTPFGSDGIRTVLADLRVAPPNTVPGWRSRLGLVLFDLAWYAATIAVMVAFGWNDLRADVGVLLVGIPLVLVLVGMSPAVVGRIRKRLDVSASSRIVMPEHLVTPVVGRGLRTVELRMQLDAKVRDRSVRAGRSAWIVVSWRTLRRPLPLRFVVGHELAHVLRNDSSRRRTAIGLYAGVLTSAVLSFDITALIVASISALAHRVVTGWWAELSCDAAAIRWAGVDSLQAWAADHRSLLREPPNHTLGRRLIRLRGLLTHPPTALRAALHPPRR